MSRRSRLRLVLGRDYVLDERGRAVFTRDYLLSMGTCCGNGCLNCPYPTCASREPVATDGADTSPGRAADAGRLVPRRYHPGMFTHVVLFWMKPDTSANATQQTLDDCHGLLAKIPTLKFFDVGRPAMTPRDVVDNTYDVGLLTVFADRAGHDAYQEHPLHKEFIARNKANWLRVQVYDFVG